MDQDQDTWDAICGTDEDFANWMCEGQHPEMQKLIRKIVCKEPKIKIEISFEAEVAELADARD